MRLAAIVALAATFWPLRFDRLRAHRGWLVGIAAAYVLLLLQLVPLPPGLWARLPGYAVYAQIAEQAGAWTWRPLSLAPDLTVNALLALLPATAAALAALHLDSRGRRRLAQAVVVVASISGLLGLIQLGAGGNTLHLFRQSSDNSAVGLFANRNHQAVLIACALPLVGVWFGMKMHRAGSLQTIAAFATLTTLLLVALVATRSRMGLALALLGLAGSLLCFRAANPVPAHLSPRLRVAMATGIPVLAAAIGFLAYRLGLLERLASSGPAGEARAALLTPFWHTAEAFLPWGAGFGAFDSVYRRFEPDALLSTIYMNHAHAEPIELAIEGGLPALILLAIFLWWWGATVMRISRAILPAGRRAIALAAITITALLMISSLVDYPLRTPLLGALFALCCVEMLRTRSMLDRIAAGCSL